MKVACVCNMNNNFFSIVRHLRDNGIEADLLLQANEMPHFHPANDTFDLDYQKFTKTVKWGHPHLFDKVSAEQVYEDIKEYDYIIGCGTAAAYLKKAGRPLDMMIPYGADLYIMPFFKLRSPRVVIPYNKMAYSQKKGIQALGHIGIPRTNSDFESYFDKLKVRDKVVELFPPMVYTPLYNQDSLLEYKNRSHWYHAFKKIRDENDLVLFHQSRHVWKSTIDQFSYKGNEKLLNSFAELKKRRPGIKAHIILFEYGNDVMASKMLIKELGFEEDVTWFPLLPRKEVMMAISQSDICVGQLGNTWLIYGSLLEILVMSKPFMGHRDDPQYHDSFPELYPMMNITTEEDIVNYFEDYLDNPEKYVQMGQESGKWALKHFINDPLEKLIGMIKAKTQN